MVLIGGVAQVDAAGRYGHVHLVPHTHLHAAAGAAKRAPLTCGDQPNLDDPTNSTNQALVAYYFDDTHAGVTHSYCRLGFHISAGDTISVHFSPLDQSDPPAVTLAMYVAPGLDPDRQTLAGCSSNMPSTVCGSAARGDILTVQAPPCGFQVDFIYGTAMVNLPQGTFRAENRLIDGRTGSLASSGCPNAKPTPTASPESTSTASPDPTGGVLAAAVTTPLTGAGSPLQPLGIGLFVLGVFSMYASRRYLAATDV